MYLRVTEIDINIFFAPVLDPFHHEARLSRKLSLEVMPKTRDHQHGRTKRKCPRRKLAALNQVSNVETDAEDGDDAADDKHRPCGPVKTRQRLLVAKLQREQSESCEDAKTTGNQAPGDGRPETPA